ncbi:hypothetical protein [Cryobacterium roopkundense]|uniref:Uncharacterized protein n=1 Tax=Cryobacterium roopkundense TaxID=1001240 RepID=A0A7W9E4E1_9MICO|nr:hypothetical protein [Cryobacterium roopkundense]MBB5640840.1 hypothetical protein [Cryobacterium roopkundense]
MQELQDRVRLEHGAHARIISAERVTVGGVRGFFARQHFEATVEVGPVHRRAERALLDVPARLGIAALLDDADAAEARSNGLAGDASISTESDDFAALMDDLTFATARTSSPAEPLGAPPDAPAPLARAGDLVLVIGLTGEALEVARAMVLLTANADLRVGGSLSAPGLDRVDDRRDALAARARGVELDQTTFVAFGLARPGVDASADLALRTASIGSVGADQVWVVVDTGRKVDDTARWVSAIAESVHIDAVAAVGAELTTSPETVSDLRLPVRWIDLGVEARSSGRRAAAPIRGAADRSR